MATETSRCSGHCCKDFCFPISPMEFERHLKRAKIGKSRLNNEEVKQVVPMLIFLRADFQHSAIPRGPRSKELRYHYTCKHFDQLTGDCTNYENRPNMCRSYPNGQFKENGACYVRGCTRRCEPVVITTLKMFEGKSEHPPSHVNVLSEPLETPGYLGSTACVKEWDSQKAVAP